MSGVDDLGRRLVEVALLEGDFVLRSGARSRWYLDKYRFETDPALLGPIGSALAELVAQGGPAPDRLAGPELGAVPLAAATALASGIPFLIVRKETKQAVNRGCAKCLNSMMLRSVRIAVVSGACSERRALYATTGENYDCGAQ